MTEITALIGKASIKVARTKSTKRKMRCVQGGVCNTVWFKNEESFEAPGWFSQ